jgi:Subtilase family
MSGPNKDGTKKPAGRNTYQRGEVAVTFEPRPNLLAMSVRHGHPQAPTFEGLKERLQLERVPVPEGVPGSHVHIVSVRRAAELEVLARELAAHPAAIHVGQVVGLGEEFISFLSGEAIVRFRQEVDDTAARRLLAEAGLETLRVVPYSPNTFHVVQGPVGLYTQLDVLGELQARPEVLWAEPNLVTVAAPDSVTPADYLWPGVWDRNLVGGPDAWQHLQDAGKPAYGEPSILLAIPDLGVVTSGGVPTHPEFQGTLSDGRPKMAGFFDFVNMVANHDSPLGDHGMGTGGTSTALAGNLSSAPGFVEGLAGMAPNVQLLAMIPQSDDTDVADMYIWAAGFDPASPRLGFPARRAVGADVFSSSVGFGTGAAISGIAMAMFDFITTYGRGGKGCVTFQSAGNANIRFDPSYRPYGAYERSIAVGASTLRPDGTEAKANYSDWGPLLGVCAPSNSNTGRHNPPNAYGVLSCDLPGSGELPGHPDNTTSLATASVAGTTSITVANTTGFAAGKLVVIGAVGSLGWEAGTITGVNAATGVVTLALGLLNPHPAGTVVACGPANGYTNNFGGTSSATPLTAGIAALILSANPALTWVEVRQILRDTAVKIDVNNSDPVGQWLDSAGNPSRTSGNPAVFSQWYGYGRVDAAAAVQQALTFGEAQDVYVRDNLADVGLVPAGVPFWDSPDIWVRNLPPAMDGGAALPGSYAVAGPHQGPMAGQDNWVYVRYRNRGTQPTLDFYVRVFIAHYPGTEFIYPDSFLPGNRPGTPVASPMTPGTYLLGMVKDTNLAAGLDRTINVQWPAALIPPADVTVGGATVHWHPCLLVDVSPHDGPAPSGNHVWDDNDLGQKNVTIVYVARDASFDVGLVVGSLNGKDGGRRLEIDRSEVPAGVRLYVGVSHPGVLASLRELEHAARSSGEIEAGKRADDVGQLLRQHGVDYRLGWDRAGRDVAWLRQGPRAVIPLVGLGRSLHPVVLGGVVESDTPIGDYRIHVIERDAAGNIAGGAAIELRVGVAAAEKSGRRRRAPIAVAADVRKR